MKPELLDLFCGAGGCTRGYQNAGFYVVGVDNRPQPHYVGDEFYCMDAFEFLQTQDLARFAAIHAGPPCQAYTQAQRIQGRNHPNLIPSTRDALIQIGKPFVIENVPGAPLRPDLILCGSMFGLRWHELVLYRHRWFESGGGFHLNPFPPATCLHNGWAISIFGHTILGKPSGIRKTYKHPNEREHLGIAVGRAVMEIDWMNRNELSEAIPPSYTHFIGGELMRVLQSGS